MRLAIIINIFPFALGSLLSCNEHMELTPPQCDCEIDGIQLSESSLVTYRVMVHDDAFISSVTYRTTDGTVTTDHPSIPFSTAVQLDKGETIALRAEGNPGKGSIVLTYETHDGQHTPSALSATVSKAWVLEGGICR